MIRAFYFVGGLVALTLIFVTQFVVLVPAPRSGAAPQDATAPTAAPDATSVAIDDLAAWPAAAGR